MNRSHKFMSHLPFMFLRNEAVYLKLSDAPHIHTAVFHMAVISKTTAGVNKQTK